MADLTDLLGMITPGDDAYNGESEPQARELTARERDVLMGVISDIIGTARRTRSLAHLRGGEEWFRHLVQISLVISPRRENRPDLQEPDDAD